MYICYICKQNYALSLYKYSRLSVNKEFHVGEMSINEKGIEIFIMRMLNSNVDGWPLNTEKNDNKNHRRESKLSVL